MRDVENELRRVLANKSEQVADGPGLTTTFVRRVRLARTVVPTLALAVVAVGAAGALSLPFELERSPAPAPAGDDSHEQAPHARAQPRESYPIPDAPMFLTQAERGLWAIGFRITHIDFRRQASSSTEQLVSSTRGLGGAAKGAAFGLGKAWAAFENEEEQSRLIGAELKGNRVVVTDEIDIEGLRRIGDHHLAVGLGAVWVTSADGTVQRYDPTTQEIDTFDLGEHFKDYSHGNGALLVAAGDEYVWFAATPGSVVAFDPQTMEPAGLRKELDWNVVQLEFSDGRLVILQTTPRGAHRLWQIEEDGTLIEPISVGKYGPHGTLVTEGATAHVFRWKRARRSFIYRVELRKGRVIKHEVVARDPYRSFTVASGYGWVGDIFKREIRRVPLPQRLRD